MADAITWSLTANTSSVAAEMGRAVGAVNSGSAQMVQSLNRADHAHGNLLTSSHKAARQLQNMAQTMASGADTTTVLVQGLEAVERATRLPLGSLAGLAISAVAIESVASYREEWKKLGEQIEKTGKMPGNTTKDLEARIAAQKAATEAFKERAKAETGWSPGAIWNRVKRAAGDVTASTFGVNLLNPLAGAAMYSLQPHPTDIRKETEEKITELKHQQLKDEQEMARLKHDELTGERASRKLENLRFTLQDLAREGRDTAAGDDSRAGSGKLARRALALQDKARKAMMSEHYDEAFGYQSQADAIKNSIFPLKDTEKDMLNAIERAEVLKQMLAGINRLSFANR